MDWQDIPVFIVNRNRLSAMQTLVDWLLGAGTRKIVVLDNDSSYPPLLAYYERLPVGVQVVRLPENQGPYVLWKEGLHQVIDTPYIVTDSDLIPSLYCPSDMILALTAALERFPDAGKVGPGLRIDNLPDSYREADVVRKWESQFWEQPLGDGYYAAPIDTTFALYPARAAFTNDVRNIRLGEPYLMEHTPWYADEASLSEEEAFYRSNTSPVFSNWSVEKKDSWVARSERVMTWSQRPKILHVGGRDHYIFGWINAGMEGRHLDLRFDLENCALGTLDLPDDSIDGVYIGSEFTCVAKPYALLDELYRVCKPGARLVLRLPHGASDRALEDPRCQRTYVETSFVHFSQAASARRPGDYRADWQVLQTVLEVSPELVTQGADSALASIRERRNQVEQMLVTLQALKPARRPPMGMADPGVLSVVGEKRLLPSPFQRL